MRWPPPVRRSVWEAARRGLPSVVRGGGGAHRGDGGGAGRGDASPHVHDASSSRTRGSRRLSGASLSPACLSRDPGRFARELELTAACGLFAGRITWQRDRLRSAAPDDGAEMVRDA